jgi:hypothetical protein
MPPTRMHLRGAALGAAALACALAAGGPLAGASIAGRGGAAGADPALPGTNSYSATLERCTPSAVPAERSVTFAGRMLATPGTQRMDMRIELQERTPSDSAFRMVIAPGLGVWRSSEPGVTIYRYVKQITNLAAPATYRAVVRFRWMGDKDRVLKRAELRTAKCSQPPPAPAPGAQPVQGG